jgi:hypothetical protein
MDIGRIEEGMSHMRDAHTAVARKLGTQHPVVEAMGHWL